eukprot:6200182-Pleurochrysis_carterae.AAC.4
MDTVIVAGGAVGGAGADGGSGGKFGRGGGVCPGTKGTLKLKLDDSRNSPPAAITVPASTNRHCPEPNAQHIPSE